MGGDDITSPPSNPTGIPQVETSNTQSLLDEIFGSSAETTSPQTPAPPAPTSPPPKPRNPIDDILGLFPDSTPTPSPNQTNTGEPALAGFGGGLTSPTYGIGSPIATSVPQSALPLPQTQSPPQQLPQQQKLTAYTAYEKNELKVALTPQTSPNRPGVVNILARFQVIGQNAVSGLSFQVAVPKVRPLFLPWPRGSSALTSVFVMKNQQLQMLAMSNPNVNPGSVETQQMQIKAPVGVSVLSPLPTLSHSVHLLISLAMSPQSQIRLRLRLSYLINGQHIQDQVDFSGFPQNLMTSG